MTRLPLLQRARLVLLEALRTQRHGLVDAHAIPDDGGLADHHARAVVDEKAVADARAGMDVDAGLGMRQFGHDAREQREITQIEFVRQPVMDDGHDAGIAEQHLVDAARGRVAVEGSLYIGVEERAYRGQRGGELPHNIHCAGFEFLLGDGRLPARIAQLQAHLPQQCVQRGIKREADVEIFALLTQIAGTKAHREERTAQGLDDAAQRFPRGKLTAAHVTAALLALAPFLAHGAQFRDHAVEFPVGLRCGRLCGGVAHGSGSP